MAEARKSAEVSSSTKLLQRQKTRTGAEGTAKSSEETTEGEGRLAPERGAWPGASPPRQSRAGEERAHLTWRLRAENGQRRDKKEANKRRAGKQAGKAADAEHRDGPEGQDAKGDEGQTRPEVQASRNQASKKRQRREEGQREEKKRERQRPRQHQHGQWSGGRPGKEQR